MARGTPLFVFDGYERQCPEPDCGAWFPFINTRSGGVFSHMVTFHATSWPTWRAAVLGAQMQEAPAEFQFNCGLCYRRGINSMIGLDQAGYLHMMINHQLSELTDLWIPGHLEELAGGDYSSWLWKREVRLSLKESLGSEVLSWACPPVLPEFWLRRSDVEEHGVLSVWGQEVWNDSEFGVHVRGEPDEGVEGDNA